MNKIKFAAPLYIVRKECEKDLFSVLEKIKALGFDGVEFLGFFGKSPAEIRRKLEELELEAVGNHVDYQEFIEDTADIVKAHKEIGCNYITVTGLPENKITDRELLSEYINNIINIGQLCREEGITLLYHNHDKELHTKIGEKYLLEVILDSIPGESISFEPDLGWIAIGGGRPEYFLDKYKDRCPVIHLKDFYTEDISKVGKIGGLSEKGDETHSYFEFRPVGYGIANLPALMKKILQCNPLWLEADHDLAYDRDSYFDLRISLDYMKNLVQIAK